MSSSTAPTPDAERADFLVRVTLMAVFLWCISRWTLRSPSLPPSTLQPLLLSPHPHFTPSLYCLHPTPPPPSSTPPRTSLVPFSKSRYLLYGRWNPARGSRFVQMTSSADLISWEPFTPIEIEGLQPEEKTHQAGESNPNPPPPSIHPSIHPRNHPA